MSLSNAIRDEMRRIQNQLHQLDVRQNDNDTDLGDKKIAWARAYELRRQQLTPVLSSHDYRPIPPLNPYLSLKQAKRTFDSNIMTRSMASNRDTLSSQSFFVSLHMKLLVC